MAAELEVQNSEYFNNISYNSFFFSFFFFGHNKDPKLNKGDRESYTNQNVQDLCLYGWKWLLAKCIYCRFRLINSIPHLSPLSIF